MTHQKPTQNGDAAARNGYPGVVTCQTFDCRKSATVELMWKTVQMPAPAFWYLCHEHADEVRAGS